MNTLDRLKKEIADTPIILYMKGSPERPQCGFSARAVQALHACGAKFISVDVLSEPEVRQVLPEVANWPTFPQLFVKGELIGGSDIILEMQANGELQQLINEVQQHYNQNLANNPMHQSFTC